MIIPAILSTPSGGVVVASPSTSLREQVQHSLLWPSLAGAGSHGRSRCPAETGNLRTGNCSIWTGCARPGYGRTGSDDQAPLPGVAVVMLDSDSGQALPGFTAGWEGD